MSSPFNTPGDFNYDWRGHDDWRNRYPSWALGSPQWLEYSDRLSGTPGDRLIDRLPELSQRTVADIPGPCPRVFISHRRDDKDEALRVAELVLQCGYNYWLDILDPQLLNIPKQGLPKETEAIAMAAVIEMALLNCTHVIALISPHTKGTMWMPYEYGRVKEPPPVTLQAACWVHRDYTDDLPEYLHLGLVHYQEGDIRSWLTPPVPSELPKPPCNPKQWTGDPTKQLPCR